MNKLKQLRVDKGLSQAMIAKELGITQQAYANYENGKREPDQTMLVSIADFFNISIDTLLDRQTQKPEVSDSDIMFALFGTTDVSEEDLEDVKRFAKFIKDKKTGGKEN